MGFGMDMDVHLTDLEQLTSAAKVFTIRWKKKCPCTWAAKIEQENMKDLAITLSTISQFYSKE